VPSGPSASDRLRSGVMRMTPRMTPALDMEFSPDASVIRTARDAVAAIAHDIPREKSDDLRLLVSELVTNSLRHAALTPEDRIGVRLFFGGGVVRVEILDPGPGFDAPSIPGISSESGWGLVLIDRLSDRWGGINSGDRTCIWFELDL
jgi:anti-sigma regulatory factor (Ser/Thr protein kinase)